MLVVVSPKYRRETDTFDMDNDADDNLDSDGEEQLDRSHRLHTKQIYRLMYSEYAQNQCTQRFVPLVFPGMTKDLIPHWLIETNNKPYYKWPEQYKDLLWMLTKPENRVPEHTPRTVRIDQETQNMENESAEIKEELE